MESGPPPMKLSDGNYFFIYNSARRTGKESKKKDWDTEYNPGYVIMPASDPTTVLFLQLQYKIEGA